MSTAEISHNDDSKYQQVVMYCVDKILSKPNKPLFVAVTGESGSGKSYFTKSLQKEMSARSVPYSFVNHDDFLIPRQQRQALRQRLYLDGEFKGKSHWEVVENWYYLDNFQMVLDKLRQDESVSYYPYSHESGETLTILKTIEPSDIILFDNKLFLDQMDLLIELSADRQNIISRKITRDSDVRTPEQTIEMHELAQGYFWDRNRPLNPDILIDNNDFSNVKLVRQ